MSHFLIEIAIYFVLAVILMTKSTINMIQTKETCPFTPFFIVGLTYLIAAGLTFYGFYNQTITMTTVMKTIVYSLIIIVLLKNKK